MRFAAPELLWLLLALPILALVGWWARLAGDRALRRFAGSREHVSRFTGQVSRNRRAIKQLLFTLALATLCLALARPQWGTRLESITRHGSDIVLILDTSLSMASEDVAPSRLEQAKHAIGSLLDLLAGDRVALVTFAGKANANSPLTVDHGAVRLFLESMDVHTVSVPGTALGEALQTALRLLRSTEHEVESRGKAIVLLSDGEDHAGDLEPVLDELARNRVLVYTVGCGSTRGAPIPLKDSSGNLTGYKKNRDGQVVTTRLSEHVLENIALETGGRYYRATTSEVEVDEIARALSSLSRGELGSEIRTRREERFQFPLAIAWLALVSETLLGDRRRVRDGERSLEREAA
jgi:Ca-activated chloride channel family protein